jgi:ribosomal protein L12E/L44/L45/RPP1/RPP2
MRTVLIAAVLTATAVSFGMVTPGADTPVAAASPANDKKDDKDSKNKNDKKDNKQDDDRGDDYVLNGQVLEVHTEKNPPELIVGTVDGRARVRVLKTDEIARNGVGVGDYIELTGEKINELLFEATEISVGQRFAGPASSYGQSSNDDEGEGEGPGHEDGGSEDESEEP